MPWSPRVNASAFFVEINQVAHFVPVETGFQDGWQIQIKKGLSPGDHVIVVGQRIIEDDETVNVTRTLDDAGELVQ